MVADRHGPAQAGVDDRPCQRAAPDPEPGHPRGHDSAGIRPGSHRRLSRPPVRGGSRWSRGQSSARDARNVSPAAARAHDSSAPHHGREPGHAEPRARRRPPARARGAGRHRRVAVADLVADAAREPVGDGGRRSLGRPGRARIGTSPGGISRDVDQPDKPGPHGGLADDGLRRQRSPPWPPSFSGCCRPSASRPSTPSPPCARPREV